MTASAPTYDLVLLLDLDAEEAARGGVVTDVQKMITSYGQLLRHDEWGSRELAYPIAHKKSAEYHLYQFHGSAELLSALTRSLSITDSVVRFRVVKLKPGTPEPPDMKHSPSEAEAEVGVTGSA